MIKLMIFISAITSLFLFKSPIKKEILQRAKKDTIVLNISARGVNLELDITKGKSFSYPLIAVWIEDLNGKYIQTIYVAKSIATGYFKHGKFFEGKWNIDQLRRPAALPYWSFKRGVIENDGLYVPTNKTPIVDAYTSATPTSSFILKTKTDSIISNFRLCIEINQSFDYNNYWNNNKYPNDDDYKASGQPSIIYAVDVKEIDKNKDYILTPIGHGHYSGKTGELNNDLSTLSTALKIIKSIKVRFY